MKRKIKEFEIKDEFCFRCGSFEVEVDKKGKVTCQNCGATSYFDEKSNTMYTSFKVKDIFGK